MAVNTGTILRDSLFYVKNFLLVNLSDPISNRPSGQQFILTSYPTRPVSYPIITLKDKGNISTIRSGFQSQISQYYIEVEVRVWANDVKERDKLTDSIYQLLKNNQFASSGQISNSLHDFQMLNAINIDDPDGPKCKLMTFRWLFVAT